jgi:integration host factor subunit alpha
MDNKKNIIRADLANIINEKIGVPSVEASEIVDFVLDQLVEGLIKDGEVKIKNFGVFKLKHKKERIGRNPKTKEEKIISARNVVSFYPAKDFKNKINNNK